MLTEDYLMRMINLAVAAILRAVGLRKDGEYTKAHQEVEQALEQLTGLRWEILQNLEDPTLLGMLTTQEHLDRDRALLVAELFQEQGEIYSAQGKINLACSSWNTALFLTLEYAFEASSQEAKVLREKVEYLIQAAQSCSISFNANYSLFNYYELTGNYANAAQVITQLAASGNFQSELEQEIHEFYLRLLQLPDTTLIQGGLTRSQVQQMLQGDQR